MRLLFLLMVVGAAATALPVVGQIQKNPGTVQAHTFRETNSAGTAGQPLVAANAAGDAVYTNTVTVSTAIVSVVNATFVAGNGSGLTNLNFYLLPVSGDDSAHIQAVAAIGAPIYFTNGVYDFGVVQLSASNVKMIGAKSTIFKLSSAGSYSGFLQGSQNDLVFENIVFDGNQQALIAAGLTGQYPISLSGSRDVVFRNCTFKDFGAQVYLDGSKNITFSGCKFVGIGDNTMASGTWSPAAPATNTDYSTYGIDYRNSQNVTIENCSFDFLKYAVFGEAVSQQSQDIVIRDCTFRGDWWNNPLVIQRFNASAWATNASTVRISCATNINFRTAVMVVIVPVLVTNGTTFTTGQSSIVLDKAVTVSEGDVLETLDGHRAEILSATTASATIQVRYWELQSTFGPSDYPTAQQWRIRRYFASKCTKSAAGQVQTIYTDFINPFTGWQLGSNGVNIVGTECFVCSELVYSGPLLSDVYNGKIIDCSIRGCVADCLSMVNSSNCVVSGNTIVLGQDEGMTIGSSSGVVAHNTVDRMGISCLYATANGTNILFSNNRLGRHGYVDPTQLKCVLDATNIVYGADYVNVPKVLTGALGVGTTNTTNGKIEVAVPTGDQTALYINGGTVNRITFGGSGNNIIGLAGVANWLQILSDGTAYMQSGSGKDINILPGGAGRTVFTGNLAFGAGTAAFAALGPTNGHIMLKGGDGNQTSATNGLFFQGTNNYSATKSNTFAHAQSGKVKLAYGAATYYVTNNLVTTNSIIIATINSVTDTERLASVVPTSGLITISLNTLVSFTAGIDISWFIVSP